MALMALGGNASPAASCKLDPIVPYMYRMGSVPEAVADLKNVHARTGLRRFFLCGPGFNEVMYRPFAPDLYERMGREIGEVKKALAPFGVEVGWWCSPSIRYWSDLPTVEDAKGNRSVDNKKCPLDPAFQADFAAKVKSVAAAARPAFINIEDDYTLAYSRGLHGRPCYCRRHLADFARRHGRVLSAAEIEESFKNRTDANLPLRRAWAETIRESLVTLARKVRAAVDEVDPTIRIFLCQPGGCDTDGDSSEAVARAFAGKTRPGLRPFGAIYGAQTTPADIPGAVSHTFFTLERTPNDIETFYEADPYPHNRFYTSAAQMLSLMSGAIFAGSQDLQFYCLQYLDDPLEDPGYADAYNAAKPRLEAVRRFIAEKGAKLEGVRVVWRSEDVCLTRGCGDGHGGQLSEEAFLLAKTGLPYTTRADAKGSAILAGAVAETMSDDDIRAFLQGGVLLDAPAADLLRQRGFGAFLGADVKLAEGRLPIVGETILPAAGLKRPGKTVNAFYIFNAGTEGTVENFATLKLRPGTEVWSAFSGVDKSVVTPSLTVATNALGGRVAILATSLLGNRSSGLYNLRKQELLHNLFERLSPGAIPVAAIDAPGIWTLANVAADGKSMLVMVDNLSGDERGAQKLAFAPQWIGATVSRLGADGRPVPLGRVSANWTVPFVLGQMLPEYLLVERGIVLPPNTVADAAAPVVTGARTPRESGVLSVVSDSEVATERSARYAQPPVGWMSWYALKFATDDEKILDNARRFRKLFSPYCNERSMIWVDWEWYHEKFGILPFDAKGANGLMPNSRTFPRGLKPLADDLKAMGFTPGLWISLVTDIATNAVCAARPEWLAPAAKPTWIGSVFADPFAPGFIETGVPQMVGTYLSWGYEAFKLDGVYVLRDADSQVLAPRYGNVKRDYAAMVGRLAAAVRRAIGPNRYFLDCGCTTHIPGMPWPLAEADAMRTGSDVFSWREFVDCGVREILKRYHRHGRGIWLDLDTLVLRPEASTLREAQTRVSFYALTGVPITIGDPIDKLDEDRINLLRRAMPVVPIRSVLTNDLSQTRLSDLADSQLLVDAEIRRPFANWHVAGAFNFGSNRVERTIDFGRDLHQTKPVAVWDFWNDRFFGVVTNSLAFVLEPHETRVLRVTPVAPPDRATLLSVSRHVTQGGYELTALESKTGVLSGRVRVVGGEPCRVTILLPDGSGEVKTSHPFVRNGNVVRLKIAEPKSGTIPFSVAFTVAGGG